ncbi:MAG: acetoin dehydrogenase [Elusimicrobia bacterium GWC2_51_8]|nr:MAG: acetoin dehydrogenase [Elusimicrobia bacterium GWA2_51_34]OGR62238.1 MAG: acetoin dehydrogenase [Elusimicrobia bacterium GWC2_51_8]OGR88381.1 MAG: acetoin dehydrogenase [Elusimicrobia bacterium GWF2_52_66]HAF94602.1 alpha-ketoacid dehydrogenase subunit beta [Elusimicrobiota bacterium]HCE98064.1 alpha-ketoacid dehydrogenase subunit beta [Elusimicrobiota bacterium]
MRLMTYAKAINEAYIEAMRRDKNVIAYGLGIDDPKGVFGTTLGLKDKFGKDRVFDTPTSENAMTGVGIGASLNGIRPVMCHQRVDFFLLAMDQLVNNAAKWHYMFGGGLSVPITIRLIIGRGWGQGPTHSQSLQAWFAHIPGLKVVMPATAADAKGLLLSAIFDENPVIYLEHRWLHNLEGDVPAGDYRVPIGKAKCLKKGGDISIVSFSYMTIEALRAVELLEKAGISCELIDLRTIKPIDWKTIFCSVRKTGRLLVLDTGVMTCGIAGEIIASVCTECFGSLKHSPVRIASPDIPTPTSYAMTRNFYSGAGDIARKILEIFGKNTETEVCGIKRPPHHDVPGEWFKGPF